MSATQLHVAQVVARLSELAAELTEAEGGRVDPDWVTLRSGPTWLRQAAAERIVATFLVGGPHSLVGSVAHLENATDLKGIAYLLCILRPEDLS